MNEENLPPFSDEPESTEDELDLELLQHLDEELVEEEAFYEELPEDWDVEALETDIPDEPEILAEVDDAEARDDNGGMSTTTMIVLSGPRAGTVLSEVGGATPLAHHMARKVGSASAALAPGEVLVLVHRPGRYDKHMPHALARVHADFSHTGLHVGISAGLPRKGATKTKEYLDRCAAAAVRVADPEGYALPTDLISDPPLSTNQLAKGGYLDPAVAPAKGSLSTTAWNEEVIRTQRAAGANVLLTPGRSLDPTDPTTALREAGHALDVLLGMVEATEVPAWNLTLPGAWLTTPTLRQQLLAELVDRDDALVWHIRVRWPLAKPPRAFGQLQTKDLLDGYRELATTARREDRALLLPNTGLTGWLTLGWGSTGFGTGPSQTSQRWAESPRIATRKGTTRATVHRHHVAALLHTITADSHRNLARTLPTARYPACPCPFCEAQAEAPAWQPDIDAGHTIYAMGAIAAQVAGTPRRDRLMLIEQMIGDAHALHSGLPAGAELDAKESPEHLVRWTQLLS